MPRGRTVRRAALRGKTEDALARLAACGADRPGWWRWPWHGGDHAYSHGGHRGGGACHTERRQLQQDQSEQTASAVVGCHLATPVSMPPWPPTPQSHTVRAKAIGLFPI